MLSQRTKSAGLHSAVFDGSSRKKLALLGKSEEDCFSSSSLSSGSEDRITEKLTSKEFKVLENGDLNDSTSE